MQTAQEQPEQNLLRPPAYLFQLSGGVKLIVDADGQCHALGLVPGKEAHFSLNGRRLGAHLFDYPNFRVLARSKCFDDEQLNDELPNNLALRAIGPDGKCLAFSQDLHWSGVAHVLHEQRQFVEERFVRRLVTQIRACVHRFEKLFTAYSKFLGTLKSNDDVENKLLKNKHTVNIGLEFNSFLEGLYALRDAVNAIAYRMLFRKTALFSTKKFKPLILSATHSPYSQLISSSMFDNISGDLILSRMSTYRSVALHSMGTTNPITGDGVLFRKSKGLLGAVQQVIYPLYDDMDKLKEIERGTAIGLSIQEDIDELKRFLSNRTHEDALDFGFDCFERLLTLVRLLGEELHLESRLLAITDDDIVGASFSAS